MNYCEEKKIPFTEGIRLATESGLISTNLDASSQYQLSQLSAEKFTKVIEEIVKQFNTEELAFFISNKLFVRIDEKLKENGQIYGVLGVAAKVGNAELFTKIWQEQPLEDRSVLERDCYFYALIDYSVLGGSVEIIEKVWQASFSIEGVEIPDKVLQYVQSEKTIPNLLALSCESGNSYAVELILQKSKAFENESNQQIIGLLISEGDVNGYTCLMRAIMSGNDEIFIKILNLSAEQNADFLNAQNKNGQTALHIAVDEGQLLMVKKLLEHENLNLNLSITSSGFTPLHIAMMQGNLNIVEALLAQKNIYLLAEDEEERTPIFYSANDEVLMSCIDIAFYKIRGSNLEHLLEEAIDSDQLSGDQMVAIIEKAVGELEPLSLMNLRKNIIKSEKLNSKQILTILEQDFVQSGRLILRKDHLELINSLIVGRQLEYKEILTILEKNFDELPVDIYCFDNVRGMIICEAIKSEKFDGEQILTIVMQYSDDLNQDLLKDVLKATIKSGKLNDKQIVEIVKKTFDRLEEDNLVSVLKAAIKSEKLDSWQIVEIVKQASVKLEGFYLEYILEIAIDSARLKTICFQEVLEAAIYSGKLEGEEIMIIVDKAFNEMYALNRQIVLEVAIKSGRLNGEQILSVVEEVISVGGWSLIHTLKALLESEQLDGKQVTEIVEKTFDTPLGKWEIVDILKCALNSTNISKSEAIGLLEKIPEGKILERQKEQLFKIAEKLEDVFVLGKKGVEAGFNR